MADQVVIPTAGLGLITAALAASALKYIAWGTGTTAPAAAQTALDAEAAEARTVGTQSQATTDETNDTYRVQGTILAIASRTVREVALFDTSKAQSGTPTGTMGFRCVLDGSGYTVAEGDGLQFTIDIQLA